MPLKNHSQSIPGGYQFFQPETNWTAPAWQEWTQLRDVIITHRKSNPRFNLSINPSVVEQEMDWFNSKRLEAMPGTAHFLSPGPSSDASPPVFLPRISRAVAVAGKVSEGIGVLVDWLGSTAEPVDSTTAEQRASVCSKCPNNKAGGFLEFFTLPASEVIRKMLSVKNDMSLSTSLDKSLNTCSICLCPLKLKVWTPIEHIADHTSEKILSDLPNWCWIPTEIKSTA